MVVQNIGRKFAVVLSGAVTLLLAAAPPASAAHQHVFTQSSEYFEATDSNGRFTAQANMHSGWVVTMPWSFQISPAVQAIAVSPMNCTAGHNQLPYSDNHPNIPVSYHWHSSVPGNKVDNTNYDLWGNCTFRVNVGGRPGSANLKFQFHYSMFCGPCGPKSADGTHRLSSTLTVNPEF
jgi:hypothetical protein